MVAAKKMCQFGWMKRMITQVAQRLLPNYCLCCNAKTDSNLPLCKTCVTELPWHTGAQCKICAIPMYRGKLCGQCISKPPAFDRVIAPLHYQTPIDRFVPRMKFGKKLIYTYLLGKLLAEYIKGLQIKAMPEVLIPVPLHPKRLRERGFNQSTEIANILKKYLKLPVDQSVLIRKKPTQAQTRLKAKDRNKNLRGAFYSPKSTNYEHVALIDDVLTTGSTAQEASKILKKQGVKQVSVWCLARATLG